MHLNYFMLRQKPLPVANLVILMFHTLLTKRKENRYDPKNTNKNSLLPSRPGSGRSLIVLDDHLVPLVDAEAVVAEEGALVERPQVVDVDVSRALLQVGHVDRGGGEGHLAVDLERERTVRGGDKDGGGNGGSEGGKWSGGRDGGRKKN